MDRWNTNIYEDYCLADGCYRRTKNNGQRCERHHRNFYRYGNSRGRNPSYVTSTDWVSENAGPSCQICGRSVYDHGVTEFCLLQARINAA